MVINIIYITGGYLGRFYANNNLISKFLCIFLYFLSSLISSEYNFYNIKKYSSPNLIFVSYTSPTIIIQALSLIFLFSNLKINNKYIIKLIGFLIPLNMSVNIIHTRLFFSQLSIVSKFFRAIKSLSPKLLFFKIYGDSIIIYFICAFVDYIRLLLFKATKIREISCYIENLIFKNK